MIHYDPLDEDPSIAIAWNDRTGTIIDLSTGYTFRARFRNVHTRLVELDKQTGITGAATSPNVVITPAAGEFADLDGVYELILTATTGGRQRTFRKGNFPLVTITPSA